ncbi:MAG: DUF5329 domain-containing protein [Proteobacteria bacterium]|nr:DUF5329 domain-containing protein [Pseudomonadota bacterium]MDA0993255.1 DUF5329 domain-containing protein [Pseudomonadota bacterium]
MRTVIATLVFLVGLLPAGARTDDEVPAEIDYLLSAVGSSGCAFIRNGERHDSAEAEDHLRMKYRKGKRHVPTTEMFIERLASGSSLSKKSYYIECKGQERITSGEWLTNLLNEYRVGTERKALKP